MRPNVIIADDDPFITQLLSEICDAEDMQTRQAEGGEQVIELIRQAPPDLLLLDIMMPDMNGLEVLEEIGAMTVMRDVPVIVISACSDNETIRKGYLLGAADYFTKPFRVVEFIRRVRTHLKAAAYQRLPGGPLDHEMGDETDFWAELRRILERSPSGDLTLVGARPVPQALAALFADSAFRLTPLFQVGNRLRLELRGLDRLFLLPSPLLIAILPDTGLAEAEVVRQRLDRRAAAILTQLLPGTSQVLDWTLCPVPPEPPGPEDPAAHAPVGPLLARTDGEALEGGPAQGLEPHESRIRHIMDTFKIRL